MHARDWIFTPGPTGLRLWLAFWVGAFLALLPAVLQAQMIRHYCACDYTNHWDDPHSTISIGCGECDAASCGKAVGGLDRNGEWIEFNLDLQEDTEFYDCLYSAAAESLVRRFAVQFLDPIYDDVYEADTLVTHPAPGGT